MRHLAVAGFLLGAAILLARFAGLELRPAPAIMDRPFSLSVAEGQGLHIVVLGSSLSKDELWPERVAERLRESLEREVTLSVVAQNGAGSAWGVTQVGEVAALKPDLVLVEFAINDADITDGMSLTEAAGTHTALVEQLRSELPEAEIALMTMSPARGLRGLVRPRLRAHYLQYRALAEELALGLVDLYPRWLAVPRGARGLARDGLHPEAEIAARIIAPTVAEAIACAVMRSGCGPRAATEAGNS